MSVAEVIAGLAFLVALIGLVLNGRKDTRSDAAANAIIDTKLNSLIGGVDEIRVEMRSMRESVNEHGERLGRVEERTKIIEHRLDAIEGKGK